MTMGDLVQKVTRELSAELLAESYKLNKEIVYAPMPHPAPFSPDEPVWRVRMHPIYDTQTYQAFEINGEAVLGRGMAGGLDVIDLQGAEPLGVSRRHALLRPTLHELFVIDLNSTNGTWLNGRSIGVNIPYSLKNGDYLRLGRMELIVFIENRSRMPKPEKLENPHLTLASSIMTQLDQRTVLNRSTKVFKSLTGAQRIDVWLIDESSGELYLEGDDVSPQAYQVASEVLTTGEAHHVSLTGEVTRRYAGTSNEIFLPLKVGGVTFGVLSACRSSSENGFSHQEFDLLNTGAQFLAIALQNARVHQAARNALRHHNKMVVTLNYLFQNTMRQLVRRVEGYTRMLHESGNLSVDDADSVEQVWQVSTTMTQIVDQLIDITRFMQEPASDYVDCDLVDLMQKVVEDVLPFARRENVRVTLKIIGQPYSVVADAPHLYLGIFNLVSNAVKFSSAGDTVATALIFQDNEIVIRIVDNMPNASSDAEQDQIFCWREGVGLTLVMVQAVVEAHRGRFIVNGMDENTRTEYLIKLPGVSTYKETTE